MKTIDFNCFVGDWPFHKIRNSSFDNIQALHKQNDIDYGYVSSTNAIFYNDPYEAEKDLNLKIKGSNYKHVMTINPTLPGFIDDIDRAVKELHIAGVRILPGFHDYTLQDDVVKELCKKLKEYNLPLFLTLRMEDERCTFLFHPKSVEINTVDKFLKEVTDIQVLLCNIRLDEVESLKSTIASLNNVAFDTSGLKDGLFPLEKLISYGVINKLVYGSLAPIFCLKSTILLVKSDDIEEKLQEDILSGKYFHI